MQFSHPGHQKRIILGPTTLSFPWQLSFAEYRGLPFEFIMISYKTISRASLTNRSSNNQLPNELVIFLVWILP